MYSQKEADTKVESPFQHPSNAYFYIKKLLILQFTFN